MDPMISGGNVLAIGPAGAGKTTSLHKLAMDLRERNFAVCVVNGALVDTAAQLMELVVKGFDLEPTAVRKDEGTTLAAVARLRAAPVGGCVLIDGPLTTVVARELFGRLRDELWSLELRWALTSTEAAAMVVRVPPANAFWDRVIKLPLLTTAEAVEVIRAGLSSDEFDELTHSGWQPPRSWPRHVVREVRDRFEGTTLQPADLIQELREREAGLDRIPSMVLAELQQLGRPAAAGDTELLKRCGYSRAYVARALAELEDDGLVISFPAASDGPGRPRKLYEPALKEDYGPPLKPTWE